MISFYNNYYHTFNQFLLYDINIINYAIFQENNNLKLERFSLFHKYIIETYKRIIKTELTHIDIWFNNSIDKFKYELYEDDINDITIFEQK